MRATAIIREVESDLTEFRDLPGLIRSDIMTGLTTLRQLRDDIRGVIAGAIGGSQSTLHAGAVAIQATAAPAATVTTG